jgi:hypothetical protein
MKLPYDDAQTHNREASWTAQNRRSHGVRVKASWVMANATTVMAVVDIKMKEPRLSGVVISARLNWFRIHDRTKAMLLIIASSNMQYWSMAARLRGADPAMPIVPKTQMQAKATARRKLDTLQISNQIGRAICSFEPWGVWSLRFRENISLSKLLRVHQEDFERE